MILIGEQTLAVVEDCGRRAYPEECCGLLIGRRDGTAIRVTRAQPSTNIAAGARTRRFEIDPAARVRLMRALRGGPDTIVGHYHSHPDRAFEPSPRDVAAAFEPELVWLITAVSAGRATGTAAFTIGADGRITRRDLVVTDPRPQLP